MKVVFVLALLSVLCVTSVAEGQTIQPPSSQSAGAASAAAAASTERENPFANLFASHVQLSTRHLAPVVFPVAVQVATPSSNRRPRVVCGLTVVPVDPQFDAAMPRVVPDRNTKFTMRLVPPAVCGQ